MVLRHHKEQTDEGIPDNTGAYRSKYKKRYVQPRNKSGQTLLPNTHTNCIAQSRETPRQGRASPKTFQPKTSASRQAGTPTFPSATWSPKAARSKDGDKHTYSYGKDHHTHRGPPYHINNSSAV